MHKGLLKNNMIVILVKMMLGKENIAKYCHRCSVLYYIGQNQIKVSICTLQRHICEKLEHK